MGLPVQLVFSDDSRDRSRVLLLVVGFEGLLDSGVGVSISDA